LNATDHILNESLLAKSLIINQTNLENDQTSSNDQLLNVQNNLKKSTDTYPKHSSRSGLSEEKFKNIVIFASSNLALVNIWLSVNDFMIRNIH
jgi:hypothetical protein